MRFGVSRYGSFAVLYMFIRRKPNKSGTYSVQVVAKTDGRYKLKKSFGASAEEEMPSVGCFLEKSDLGVPLSKSGAAAAICFSVFMAAKIVFILKTPCGLE